MLANLIEFTFNHYILSGSFIILLTLLIIIEIRKGGKNLSCSELTAMVNSGQAVLLDIRSQKDFSAGHIIDSLHIPHGKT